MRLLLKASAFLQRLKDLILSTPKYITPKPTAEEGQCRCSDEIKTGQTSVMCCNVCGRPDESFWITGQTQEPVGGMEDKCSHEWVGYNQCCYCGAMKNHKGEILPMTTHPQYPVKKLAQDFEEWYFSIKKDVGKPPLAMQIFYWFSKHLNLFDELVKATPPPSPIREDERTEYYNQLTKNLGKTQPYHYTGTKCVPQCENLPHYETKHHKDCPFYKNSLSEKYDKIAPPSPVGIDVEDDIISLAESIIDRVACEASTMDVVNMILDYIASLPQSSTEEKDQDIAGLLEYAFKEGHFAGTNRPKINLHVCLDNFNNTQIVKDILSTYKISKRPPIK